MSAAGEPPDPFAGDPHDPARELAAFDDDEVREPIDPQDREDLLDGLTDVEAYEALLAPRGIAGLSVHCAQCASTHHLSWDLVRAHLRRLLDHGSGQVHEPAYGLDPARYVTGDYAQGYLDATLRED